MDIVKELESLCAANDIELRQPEEFHFQLIGVRLVNYYPTSKKRCVYINAEKRRINQVTPAQAVNLALSLEINDKPKKKKSVGRGKKETFFKGHEKLPCFYCGKLVDRDEATIDHVVPLSKGGPNAPGNKVIACHKCNQAKADEVPF